MQWRLDSRSNQKEAMPSGNSLMAFPSLAKSWTWLILLRKTRHVVQEPQRTDIGPQTNGQLHLKIPTALHWAPWHTLVIPALPRLRRRTVNLTPAHAT